MIYRAPDVVALNLNLSQEIGKTMANNYKNICYKETFNLFMRIKRSHKLSIIIVFLASVGCASNVKLNLNVCKKM